MLRMVACLPAVSIVAAPLPSQSGGSSDSSLVVHRVGGPRNRHRGNLCPELQFDDGSQHPRRHLGANPAGIGIGLVVTHRGTIDGGRPASGRCCVCPDGLILLALPSLYLSMVEEELLELPQEVLARLRFFGLGIRARIDPRLEPLVMPYDGRLEDAASRFRGTRSDFAPRALRHFAEVVLPKHPNGSADQHRSAVITALARLERAKDAKAAADQR